MEDEARIGVARSQQALNARLQNQEGLYDNNAATHAYQSTEVNTRDRCCGKVYEIVTMYRLCWCRAW